MLAPLMLLQILSERLNPLSRCRGRARDCADACRRNRLAMPSSSLGFTAQ